MGEPGKELTSAVEDYLKAIFQITEHAEDAGTTEIAGKLGITFRDLIEGLAGGGTDRHDADEHGAGEPGEDGGGGHGDDGEKRDAVDRDADDRPRIAAAAGIGRKLGIAKQLYAVQNTRGKISKNNEWTDQQFIFHATPDLYTTTHIHYGSRFTFDKQGFQINRWFHATRLRFGE